MHFPFEEANECKGPMRAEGKRTSPGNAMSTLWGVTNAPLFRLWGGKNLNWKWSMVLHNFLEVSRRICTHYYEKMLVLELSAVWDFILMECKTFLFVKWICWSISDVSQLVYGTPEPFDWLGLHPWLLHYLHRGGGHRPIRILRVVKPTFEQAQNSFAERLMSLQWIVNDPRGS